jgi:hypothetical protein
MYFVIAALLALLLLARAGKKRPLPELIALFLVIAPLALRVLGIK